MLTKFLVNLIFNSISFCNCFSGEQNDQLIAQVERLQRTAETTEVKSMQNKIISKRANS